MDPITQQQALAAAGAGGDPVYVDDVFSTFLYEGTGNAATHVNGLDMSGEGGLTIVKARTQNDEPTWTDTVNGAGNYMMSHATNAKTFQAQYISGFYSNGFSVGTGNQVNRSGTDYCSWSFRKCPGFVDIVTFTSTGSVQQISHNLGSTPGMIIVKRTDGTGNWIVWHRSFSNLTNNFLKLNTNDTEQGAAGTWGNNAPNSTHFEYNQDSGKTFVAYIFAHDDQSFGTGGNEAIIKCGSYTVPSASKFDIDLGFEPQFVLVKRLSGSSSSYTKWYVLDNMRGSLDRDSIQTGVLRMEQRDPESTSGYHNVTYELISAQPNGFQVDATQGPTATGTNGETYIYMAIRRSHKPAESATEVFTRYVGPIGNGYAGSPESQNLNMTFPPDLIWGRRENTSNGSTMGGIIVGARSTGIARSYISMTNTFATNAGGFAHFNYHPDLYVGDHGGFNDNNYRGIYYAFKRAQGFYDTAIYRGTGSAQAVNHNLGVTPELIICKSTDYSDGWAVYTAPTGSGKRLRLDGTNNAANTSAYWNDTDPTATQFTVGSDNATNGITYNYIAHLFASQPGISKIGSYTGSQYANIDVDCGFTNGARFVIVKRTDSTGDWFQWDSYGGIVSGNDKYFVLNTTAGAVTNQDTIDPLNSGFRIPSGATQNLNVTGATYIFLAIA